MSGKNDVDELVMVIVATLLAHKNLHDIQVADIEKAHEIARTIVAVSNAQS